MTATLQRLADRSVEVNECWIWTGAKTRNYGVIWHQGRTRLAHRVAYTEMVGEIPAGLELDHICRTPPCWNPWHMDPVPHAVNVRRGESPSAVGAQATHCPAGHHYDATNTYVSPRGDRRCRECKRELDRRLYHARKAAA